MGSELEKCQEKLKSLSEDMELFAHLTSHDLRDPLRQAIIDIDGNLDKQKIKNSINDVIEKIGLLREYSYMVNFDKELQTVNLNKIMGESLADMDGYIKEKNGKITCCELPQVKGYEPHLKILFSALIKNALKFNNNAQRTLDITCEDKGDKWQFKFSDNGIGLPHVYRKFVFSLLQNLEPEAEDAGYGAGLAFAKRIVENHGGEIWFESDGENGTDFYFTIGK